MKALKIYLIVVTVLLFVAIGAGVYVWLKIQQLDRDIGSGSVSAIESRDGTASTEELQRTSTSRTSGEEPTITPVVIQMSDLSTDQQKILNGLGYKGDNITLTGSMLQCFEDTIGKERMDAITSGASPTALETIRLVPCLKK